MELGVRVCASCGVQSTKVAIQIPLFFKDGEMHSYVLSYRSGIEAAAAGLSIHQGWFSGIGDGEWLRGPGAAGAMDPSGWSSRVRSCST